jgi:hypothetical protein
MNASVRILFSALLVCFMGALMPRIAHSQVTVTSADPPSAPQGTLSLDVTVSGSGFDSSAQVEFLLTGTTNPGGVTVRKVKVTGPKKLVATIDVADTAVIDKFDIQVTLSGGRKGKGTSLFAVVAKVSNDPCAAPGIDFPAFTFWRWAAQDKQIFVADATGQCIRPVLTLTDGLGFSWNKQKFSYPVAGTTNVGRFAWTAADNSEVVNLIYVFTFQVTGTSISNGTLELIYDSYPGNIWGMDLSQDGTKVIFSLGSAPSSGSPRIVALDVDSGNVQELYVGPPDGSYIDRISVNEDGALFIMQGADNSGVPRQLFRVEASCDNPTCIDPIAVPGAGTPAASLDDDRLAYLEYVAPSSSGCWLLQVIPDTGGPILNSAQPRYGRNALTWYGNKILTNGHKSPTRQGRCDSTGMITQIDPDTSEELSLVRGFDPDAR